MHWLDDLMGWTAVRPAFYRDGWGDLDRAVAQALSLTRESDILPIEITWEDEGREDAGTWVRRGSFISPRASALPEESRVAMFELVLPLDRTKEKPPIVVQLASTGDTGYGRRRRSAFPLARLGLASLLLENPYYGARKPKGQWGVALRTVADQLLMNLATIEEARSLLQHFHAGGHRVGVTGFSMGAQMAALTAASMPFPVATAICAGAASARSVMVDGVLSRGVAWKRLAGDGSVEAAKAKARTILDAMSATKLPPPLGVEAAIVWGGARDGYVLREGTEEIVRHWSGCEARWVETGHIAGYLWWMHEMILTVADSFRRAAK